MSNAKTEIFTPVHLAMLTRACIPIKEQEKVIKAPLEPTLVVAGAGSGKTETIANRLVYWVVNRCIPPQSVLGLTFTKKATAQMRQRFSLRLHNLAQALEWSTTNPVLLDANVKRFYAENRENINRNEPDFLREIRNGLAKLRKSGMTAEILRTRVEVSTYDSLAAKLLAEYGPLVGRDASYRTITDGARFQVMSSVLETWRFGLAYRQQEGASVGKLVEGLLHLAGEVNAHVVELEDMAKLYARFHDVAKRELREAEEIDQEIGRLREAKRAAEKNKDTAMVAALTNQIAASGVPLLASAKKDLAKTVEVMRFGMDAVEIIKAFNERKAKLRFADFSDQTRAVVKLLQNNQDISHHYCQRYQLVLLDEFQDTSVAQLKYLSGLFKNQAVTAVGDPNQSIYGWRGASAASIEDFPQYFSDNPAKVLSLNLLTSWRNDTEILRVANRVADQIAEQNKREGKNEKFILPRLVSPSGVKRGAGKVYGAQFLSDKEEAKAVAAFLQTWKGEMQKALQKNPSNRSASEADKSDLPTAAVLCRKKSTMPPILAELSRQGIPYQLQSSDSALLDRGVILVRACLNLVTNPANSGSLLILLDYFHFSRADLEIISHEAGRKKYLIEAALQLAASGGVSAEACYRLNRLNFILRRLEKHLPFATPAQMARLAHRLLGLDVEEQIPGTPYSAEAFEAFLTMITDFERGGNTLRAFLEWLDIAEDEETEVGQLEEPVDATKVQVITVHAAKGLEWDYVAVPSLNEGVFPDSKTEVWLKSYFTLPYPLRADRDSLPDYQVQVVEPTGRAKKRQYLEQFEEAKNLHRLKEEANLAYVAFTRAKSNLFLSSCWFRASNSGAVQPGAFFKILDNPQQGLFDPGIKKMDLTRSGEYLTLPAQWGEFEFYPPKPETNPNRQEFTAGLWPAPSWLDLSAQKQQSRFSPWDAPRLESSFKLVQSALAKAPEIADLKDASPRTLSWMVWKILTAPKIRMDTAATWNRVAATAVTRLEAEGDEFVRQKLRPLPQKPSGAARIGTIVHAWIAQQLGAPTLGFFDPSEAALDESSRRKLDRYRKTWQELEFMKDKVVTEVELGGNLMLGSGAEEGIVPLRIDAILRERDGETVWIVDWKTESRPAEKDYAKKLNQLGIYRLFWLKKHPDLNPDSVRCAYVFLQETLPENQILTLDEIQKALDLPEYTPQYLAEVLKRGQRAGTEFLRQSGL